MSTITPNLDFVTDRIATGGDLPQVWEDAVEAVRAWQDLGITHVIDNRQEWTDEDVVARLAPEIGYLFNGVDDAGNGQPDRWFDDGVAWAREALSEPDAKVLIHCHMGINRGPSLTYADAPDELRLDRPDPSPLSFGHGLHHCLGAALVRTEMRIALPALVGALGDYAILEDGLEWKTSIAFRGPSRLRISRG